MYGVIRADYHAYQVADINHKEFLAKVKEINVEIQRQIKEDCDGVYVNHLMDDVVEEFLPDAEKGDMMDGFNYDYIYLLESDGTLRWATADDKKFTTVK